MAQQQQQRPKPYLAYYPDSQFIHPHENLEEYHPGGFHPVNIGDTFKDGRYTVRHKLGYGGFSTVWLAYDRDTEEWVSLKVKSAEAFTDDLDRDEEISMLKRLARCYAESTHRGPMPCIRLLDCFHHTGPNGIHNVLVTELLGPSLDNILECYRYREQTLRPDTILRASCQLLDALAFLHQAGFAHGDISYGNVAFTCKNLVKDEEGLLEIIGEPVTSDYRNVEIPWSPDLPKHMVQYTCWPDWEESPEEELRLLDLGQAFPVGNTVKDLWQPSDVRSPETFFIGSFDYRHDLWRAGCVIHLFFHQRWLFRGWEKDEFLRAVVMRLGPVPESWQKKWEDIQKERPRVEGDDVIEPITEIFEPRRDAIISACNEEEYGYENDEYTEHDCEALDSLLWVMTRLLQYEPDKRISAQEAASYIRSKWTDYRNESGSEIDEVESELDALETLGLEDDETGDSNKA
ncbi:protein kinase-like protein [Xylariomycetidae sp. FL2044]|nr:protein kinase-like protein [Xylariomycetidae sp. FL2044]